MHRVETGLCQPQVVIGKLVVKSYLLPKNDSYHDKPPRWFVIEYNLANTVSAPLRTLVTTIQAS